MGKLSAFLKKKNTGDAPKAPSQSAELEAPREENEEELIAVLMAAVAASLNTSTYNLRIRSYRRIKNNVPVWSMAGRAEKSAAL